MAELLPAPEGANPQNSNNGGGPGGRKPNGGRRRPEDATQIPSIDAILKMLLQLNGAVTLGFVSPTKANILHRNLKTVLDVQLRRSDNDETGATQEDLLDLCRQEPGALNVIQSFLTDAQVEWLMAQISDGPNESA